MSTFTISRHYTLANFTVAIREFGFLVFSIAMPVLLFLVFSSIFGNFAAGATDVRTVMMVAMATYGSLGAAISAGAQLQVERRSGWFRQLMLTGLTPTGFLTGKVIGAMLQVLPAILAVFAVGALTGVRLPAGTWLLSGALIWIGLLPMVVLGIVIALWFKPSTVGALSTVLLLVMSMLGGLWLPVSQMPDTMQRIAKTLPTHWMLELATWPMQGGSFPLAGIGVLTLWLTGLVVLGILGYRRAVRSSRR